MCVCSCVGTCELVCVCLCVGTCVCVGARLEVSYLDGISCSHTVPWKSIYTRVVHNAFKVYKSFTALYTECVLFFTVKKIYYYCGCVWFFFFLPTREFFIFIQNVLHTIIIIIIISVKSKSFTHGFRNGPVHVVLHSRVMCSLYITAQK